ncbi:MAG: hypothetical protein WDM77_18555 [Steroidobacteraceae bacterium]
MYQSVKLHLFPISAPRRRRYARWSAVATAAFGLFPASLSLSADTSTPAASDNGYPAVQEGPPAQTHLSALLYDSEYPVIGYSATPQHNAIARLQTRLLRGEVRLKFKSPRGYLDSVLKNLGIDPSSQILVYSKSSLQVEWVNAAAPRAIYFNDDTYAAWVQAVGLLEFVTMDSQLGPVFYTMTNQKDSTSGFGRETLRCLDCHDKFALQGGGVPMFLATSNYVDVNGLTLKPIAAKEVTDQTPLEIRWGGWYVSGRQGSQVHLGNIQVHKAREIANVDLARRGNLASLAALLDTRPYVTDKSDIVALLVFEHQSTVYNLITRINFKVRSRVAREFNAASAVVASRNTLNPKTKAWMQKLTEPLVQAMLFENAAPLTDTVASTSGFDRWFQAQGPRDKAGRSLRELDLKTRLFKYPLSYLVYSPAFDGLPDYVRNYVYGRFAEILRGRGVHGTFSRLSAADRQAVTEILTATKPEFARSSGARQLTDLTPLRLAPTIRSQ